MANRMPTNRLTSNTVAPGSASAAGENLPREKLSGKVTL